MKKRLTALLLAAVMLTLSSCSYLSQMKQMIKDIREIGKAKQYGYDANGASDYKFDRSVLDAIDERFEKLDEMLKDNDESRAGAFTAMFNQQVHDVNYLADHSNIAFTNFCIDPTNEEYSKANDELSKLLNDRSAKLYRLYGKVYDSNMSSFFYDGWSEEDIAEALDVSRRYTDEYVEITDSVNEVILDYGKLDESKVDFNDRSAELYGRIVQGNNSLAKQLGYASYADYAYEYVYGRDFTPADVRNFYRYVKNHLIPLANKIVQQLRAYRYTDRVENVLSEMGSKTVTKDDMVSTLTPYYEKLGEDDLEAFESFKNNFIVATGKNSRSIAFTYYQYYYGHPSCYFGPDYASLKTFVHEQGHYLSFYKSECGISSVDLCESQSQGNEWLYLAYVKYLNGSGKSAADPRLYDYVAKYSLLNDLISLVLCACCDAFEQKVYADPYADTRNYDKLFIEAAKELGAYDFLTEFYNEHPENYWHRAIVDNSYYYISYAISLIPAFELYVIAEEDGFEAAAEIYNKLTVCDDGAGFVETLLSSELSSPFSEDLYVRLDKYFSA